MTTLNLLATICIVGLTMAIQAHAEPENVTALNYLVMAPQPNNRITIQLLINNGIENLRDNSRYHIVPHKEGWFESRVECGRMRMTLVNLRSELETIRLIQFLENNHATTFSYWIYACKNINNKNCPKGCVEVMAHNGRLAVDLAPCGKRNYFICQKW